MDRRGFAALVRCGQGGDSVVGMGTMMMWWTSYIVARGDCFVLGFCADCWSGHDGLHVLVAGKTLFFFVLRLRFVKWRIPVSPGIFTKQHVLQCRCAFPRPGNEFCRYLSGELMSVIERL